MSLVPLTCSACHRQIGCRWCSVGETGDDLREPFCSRVEDCYFGFVGHPGPNIRESRRLVTVLVVVTAQVCFHRILWSSLCPVVITVCGCYHCVRLSSLCPVVITVSGCYRCVRLLSLFPVVVTVSGCCYQ